MLTELDEANRDYPTAMKLAEKANNLTEGKEASILDTYAYWPCLKTARLKKPLPHRTKAVELAGDSRCRMS